MLMDFQIEGGQAVAAEIVAERQNSPVRKAPPAESQAGWLDHRAPYAEILTVPILLAFLTSAFIIFSRALV